MKRYFLFFILLLAGVASRARGEGPRDSLRQWDLAYRSAGAGSPDYARALGELQQGILLGIRDCDLYYRIGYCYEKLGKYELAERAFTMALGSGHNCSSGILYYVHLRAGMLDFEKGNLDDARDHFRRAVDVRPGRWVARNNLAVLDRELGGSVTGAGGLAGIDERDPVVSHNRAVILGEMGRIDEAVAEYDGVSSEAGMELRAAYNRAEILNSAGRHGEAEDAYLAHASQRGDDPAPYLRVAEIALLGGRYGRFIESLQRALDIDPGVEIPSAISLGMEPARSLIVGSPGVAVARDPDELERERAAWRDALSGNDADPRAHYELARSYEYNGAGERYGDGFHLGRAVAHYARALSLDPDYAPAHLGLGGIYHLIGDEEAALREYEAALAADRSLAAAYFNRGLILLSRGMYEEAVRDFRESLSRGPDSAPARFQLALALGRTGEYGAAVGEYGRALALLPGDPDCYYNMARIYADRLGESEKAAECFKLYLRARPGAPDRKEILELIRVLMDTGS